MLKTFSDNFSPVFPKIDKKMSQNFYQNIKKFVQSIPHISQISFTVSLKFQRNIFCISL